jgi:hypothetical protein
MNARLELFRRRRIAGGQHLADQVELLDRPLSTGPVEHEHQIVAGALRTARLGFRDIERFRGRLRQGQNQLADPRLLAFGQQRDVLVLPRDQQSTILVLRLGDHLVIVALLVVRVGGQAELGGHGRERLVGPLARPLIIGVRVGGTRRANQQKPVQPPLQKYFGFSEMQIRLYE